ncbi:MAG TPA: hypothetical protein VEO54_08885 [Thermoanaerobaculia bacterium]|nr:hypothetical protein [Thermoanaerobaculia bacterium]
MKRLALVLFLLLTVTAAFAAEKKSLTLTGTSGKTRIRLQLVLHAADMKAIRVYSQPSNTLLGVFVNEAQPDPAWLEKTFPAASRPERFPLTSLEFAPDRSATVFSDRPKIGDDTVEIYIHRGGKKKEEKIVERSNPADFKIEK